VALAELAEQAAQVARVALAELAELVAQVARVALVELAEQAAQAALAVLVVQVVELQLNRVEGLELVQVAVELARGQVAAVPERDPVAVPVRTKSVTAARRRGQVPVPRVEDLAAEVAETTHAQVAAEAATAWAAAV
jgi:hypothetical protein